MIKRLFVRMKTNKRLLLYFILLLAVISFMVLLRKSARKVKIFLPRDYAEIIESKELNVVTDYNAIGYFVSGDSIAGFQYELLKALESSWNIKVNVFLENSLEENLEGLLLQRYDIVARNIPVNIQLRDTFAFTEPITLNKSVLIQRKAEFNNDISPIRSQLDLGGKTVYVSKGSPNILRLNNLAHEIGDTIYIQEHETYNSEQLIMMVAAGDIDFAVSDARVAEQLADVFPEIDINTDISFTQLESWAVRKDSPALLDSLNNWLQNFRETKQFDELQKRYY